jgi:hypothetical protein
MGQHSLGAREIAACIESDDALRRGVLVIFHGFGAGPSEAQQDPHAVGASIGRLINMDEFDPITGIAHVRHCRCGQSGGIAGPGILGRAGRIWPARNPCFFHNMRNFRTVKSLVEPMEKLL